MAIENSQESRKPLVVPDIDVANSGSDDVSTSTVYAEDHVKAVKVLAPFKQVQLPDGFPYNGGDMVQLTQWEFDQISQAAIDADVVTGLASLDVVITDAAMDIGAGADTTEQAVANADWDDASGPDDVAVQASWASSDPAIATVSVTGLITALAAGTTDITAAFGGITSAPVTVTVSDT